MAQQFFNALYVIPNSIIPYAYETVPILGLPSGLIRRFRFSEKWVSEQFKINYKDFIKKPIFIILRNFKTGNLIPLRSGTIISISKIGDIYFISYEQGDLVEFDSNQPTREIQIETFNATFLKYHREQLSNVPEQHMKPLVFGSNFKLELGNANYSATDHDEKDLERFQNIISCIKSIDIFNGVQFLKIIKLFELKSQEPVFVKNHHYPIKERIDYILQIYQIAPTLSLENMREPNDISISSDSKYINVIEGKKRAVGKYDVLSYIFRTNPNSASAKTYLEILFKTKHEDEPFIEPSFNVPIEIVYTASKLLITILIFVSSIGLYLYPHILRSTILDSPEIIKDIALVSITVAIVELKTVFINFIKKS